jgi:hypothetical protein
LKKIVVLFLLISNVSFLSGQSNRDKVVELLLLMNADKRALQVMDLMFPEFQKLLPDVPDSFWQSARSKIDAKTIFELMIPIYQKHFTPDEIDSLISFYKTPVGRKTIEETPAIMQESMEAGKQWGAVIAEELMKELEKQGYMQKT